MSLDTLQIITRVYSQGESKYEIPIKMKYYHLSLQSNLEGLWVPTCPAGEPINTDGQKHSPYKEPTIPRICVSDNLRGCFIAIYPNVNHFYENEGIETLTFYIYEPKTIESLTEPYGVMDSHVTNEKWLLKPTNLIKTGTVDISIDMTKEIYFKPFDIEKEDYMFLSYEPYFRNNYKGI